MSSATAIRSGELRHQMQFLRNVNATPDEGGSLPEDFRPTGNPFRCSLTPLSGGKQFLAQKAEGRVTHGIVLRYREGIDPHWRIRFGSRVFTIERVINVEERNRKLEILAVEIT